MARLYSIAPGVDQELPAKGLDQFFDHACPEPQAYTIDPTLNQVIEGNTGLTFRIPANTFISSLEHQKAEIIVSLRELNDPRLAMLAGLVTNAGSTILHHSAMFSLEIMSKIEDKITVTKPIKIECPLLESKSFNNTIYHLFKAGSAGIRTTSTPGMIEWKRNPYPAPQIHRINKKRYLSAEIDHAGTYSFGHAISTRLNNIMLSVRAFGPFDNMQEGRAFIMLDHLNSTIQLHPQGQASFSGFNLPQGRTGWLIVTGWHDNQYFLGIRRLAPIANRIEQIELRPVSAAKMEHAIKNMLC